MTEDLLERVKRVKAILLDVDGILTDGSIYVGPDGFELKRFTVLDGVGAALAAQAELPLALISGRHSEATVERARQLKIEHVHLGSWNKVEALEEVLEKLGLPGEEVAFVGDSYIDMPAMELVGLPISVPNGHPLVKELAVHVTESRGGEGVLLEVVEWLLTHQGRWTETLVKLRNKLLEPQSRAAG